MYTFELTVTCAACRASRYWHAERHTGLPGIATAQRELRKLGWSASRNATLCPVHARKRGERTWRARLEEEETDI